MAGHDRRRCGQSRQNNIRQDPISQSDSKRERRGNTHRWENDLKDKNRRCLLAEERGVVGAAAKRLGISPKRLYQLLKYNNIQAREFR